MESQSPEGQGKIPSVSRKETANGHCLTHYQKRTPVRGLFRARELLVTSTQEEPGVLELKSEVSIFLVEELAWLAG